MCGGCWKEYGSPAIVNNKVLEAYSLICEVYDCSCVGGGCHVVTDDWNIEDDTIRACLVDHHEYTDSPEQTAVERRCLELLLSMTIEERASALAMLDGYVEHPEAKATAPSP